MIQPLDLLLREVRACKLCEADLPLGPRPVVQIHSQAKILIAAQAPGKKVHETRLPFNDPSGDRLRQWLGISREVFYDPERVALVPMGLCYPGTGKSGDLPPRPECATTWRQRLLDQLPNLELTLVIGQYAQAWHLKEPASTLTTLTQKVQNWRHYWPHLIPMPHPSPRNNIWLRRNPWFEKEVVPALKERVGEVLDQRGTLPTTSRKG